MLMASHIAPYTLFILTFQIDGKAYHKALFGYSIFLTLNEHFLIDIESCLCQMG